MPRQPRRPYSEQKQCMLLSQLPPELRRQIWHHVLGSTLLHVVCYRKTLNTIACVSTESLSASAAITGQRCWMRAPVFQGLPCHVEHPGRGHPVQFVTLLQTCRFVYNEACKLLYRETVFDFTCAAALVRFAEVVPPWQLARMRRVNLTSEYMYGDDRTADVGDLVEWIDACDVLSTCLGLVQLTVRLGALRSAGEDNTWLVLSKLGDCRVSERFEVVVEWPRDKCQKFASGAEHPFRLVSVLDYDEGRSEADLGLVNALNPYWQARLSR